MDESKTSSIFFVLLISDIEGKKLSLLLYSLPVGQELCYCELWWDSSSDNDSIGLPVLVGCIGRFFSYST